MASVSVPPVASMAAAMTLNASATISHQMLVRSSPYLAS